MVMMVYRLQWWCWWWYIDCNDVCTV